MTVIYYMSIDRADKPRIGDRRFTEVRASRGPAVLKWLTSERAQTPLTMVSVTPRLGSAGHPRAHRCLVCLRLHVQNRGGVAAMWPEDH